MVDPRDTMLNNARQLHERDEYNPGVCATCNTNDRYQAWPCPTATALGATGRSEWTTPDTPTRTATKTPTNRCTATGYAGPNYRYECFLTAGHDDDHENALGGTWPHGELCGKTSGPTTPDFPCALRANHDGDHEDRDGDTW